MRMFNISQFVIGFTLLYLLQGVQSQTVSRQSRSSSCGAGTECTHLGRCFTLRSLRNWREVSVTCGPDKIGEVLNNFLLVCCPRIPPSSPGLSTSKCGRSEVTNALVPLKGGESVEGAWPWMVSLFSKKGDRVRTLCSGFLIDRIHVLTAAHCLGYNKESISARFSSMHPQKGTVYSIAKIVVHKEYEKGLFYNDIAILTLDREVDLGEFNPICLPNEAMKKKKLAGVQAIEAGWFTNDENTVLRQEMATVISNEECGKDIKDLFSDSFKQQFPRGISHEILCARHSENVERKCDDYMQSGSPLMMQKKDRWYAIGIIIFGACYYSAEPQGYTSIISNLDWIKENTSQ